METFPAWAFAAAMVQVLAPQDEYLTNLLALHVMLKVRHPLMDQVVRKHC